MISGRRDIVISNATGNLRPSSGTSITVTCPGGKVSAGSSSTTIAVYSGHGFRNGDKILVQSTGDFRTINAVPTATSISVSVAVTVVLADTLLNLGSDTGTTSPNWDGSRVVIWTNPDGTSAITNATVSTSSEGEYAYFHALSNAWEIARSGSTVLDVVKGVDPSDWVNVCDFGARGDGSTDDTTAIQAAMDWAALNGGVVHLPAGIFKITSPVSLTYTSSPRLKIMGFVGEGWGQFDTSATRAVTEIRCTALASGRAAVEFLGTSNSVAAKLEVRDLHINCLGSLSTPTGTCDVASYCMRIGDAFQAKVSRVLMTGAHGLAVKISSSASYSQISNVYSQLAIYTNWEHGFVASINESSANFYSVQAESGGAFWDNVHFDSCIFFGSVLPRATLALFTNCQFANNTDRSATYNRGVSMTMGSATFKNCYFEDCIYGIEAAGLGGAKVRSLSVDACYFSPSINFGAAVPIAGINLSDGAKGVGAVSVRDSVFGAAQRNFSSGEILITGTMTTVGPAERVTPGSVLDDMTSGGTYSGSTSDNYEVIIDATGAPDTFKWRRYGGGAFTTGVAITGAAQTLSNGVQVTFAATTGHTLNTRWFVPAGLGGPESVVIDNCTLLSFNGANVLYQKPRVTVSSTATNQYFIRYHTGETVGYSGISGDYVDVPSVVATAGKSLRIVGSQDTTTAITSGASSIGIELQNLNSATGGANPALSTAIGFKGAFSTPGGRFAAIYSAVLARNTSTMREGGALCFATKTSGADTLTERMRILDTGEVGIGTATPTVPLDVVGNVKLGSASTDTITLTGRAIMRTVSVDPSSSATAGTIGEVVYSSSTAKFYGKHTTTATDTNWRLMGT